jgi:hypothetical protein
MTQIVMGYIGRDIINPGRHNQSLGRAIVPTTQLGDGDGLWEVTIYLVITGTDGVGGTSISLTLHWTDKQTGTSQFVNSSTALTAFNVIGTTLFLRQPIWASNASSVSYDVLLNGTFSTNPNFSVLAIARPQA